MHLERILNPKNLNLDWVLSPLALYILCSLCLGGSLLLWISFKKELHLVRSNTKQSYDLLYGNFQDLSNSIEMIRQTRRPIETDINPTVSCRGFDPASRTEALRRLNLNEPAAGVAATLRLPQNEVELLLKIDRVLNPGKS